MKTTGLKVRTETEKAIEFEVGFKFNENAQTIVYGKDGEENLNTGYLVYCWIPKSIIVDNEIPSWFVSKEITKKFGRFNSLEDVIY